MRIDWSKFTANKRLFVFLCCLMAILITSCSNTPMPKSEEEKDKEIADIIIAGNTEEAIQKVLDYYKDDEIKRIAWMRWIQENEEEYYKEKLEILEGWRCVKDGDYCYIRGRVKNTGDKTIRYFKLTAEFKDAYGNVLDTDFTNSGENIRPGNSKEFEIMHRYSPEYEVVSIFIDEVSLLQE